MSTATSSGEPVERSRTIGFSGWCFIAAAVAVLFVLSVALGDWLSSSGILGRLGAWISIHVISVSELVLVGYLVVPLIAATLFALGIRNVEKRWAVRQLAKHGVDGLALKAERSARRREIAAQIGMILLAAGLIAFIATLGWMCFYSLDEHYAVETHHVKAVTKQWLFSEGLVYFSLAFVIIAAIGTAWALRVGRRKR